MDLCHIFSLDEPCEGSEHHKSFREGLLRDQPLQVVADDSLF